MAGKWSCKKFILLFTQSSPLNFQVFLSQFSMGTDSDYFCLDCFPTGSCFSLLQNIEQFSKNLSIENFLHQLSVFSATSIFQFLYVSQFILLSCIIFLLLAKINGPLQEKCIFWYEKELFFSRRKRNSTLLRYRVEKNETESNPWNLFVIMRVTIVNYHSINSYGAVKTPLVIGDRCDDVVVVLIAAMLNKRWSWLCLWSWLWLW